MARLPLRKMKSKEKQLPNGNIVGPKQDTVQQNMPEMEGIIDKMEIEDQMKSEARIVPKINEEDKLFERWKKTRERDERIQEQIEAFEKDWLVGEEGIVKIDDEMIKPEMEEAREADREDEKIEYEEWKKEQDKMKEEDEIEDKED